MIFWSNLCSNTLRCQSKTLDTICQLYIDEEGKTGERETQWAVYFILWIDRAPMIVIKQRSCTAELLTHWSWLFNLTIFGSLIFETFLMQLHFPVPLQRNGRYGKNDQYSLKRWIWNALTQTHHFLICICILTNEVVSHFALWTQSFNHI
jgi:hypothetical protein